MWRHQIYWVIFYHLFLDTDQASSVSDKWNWLEKKAFCKGQTLIQWEKGELHRNFRPSFTGMHGDFGIFFDNNVSKRKGCTYLNGSLKTS